MFILRQTSVKMTVLLHKQAKVPYSFFFQGMIVITLLFGVFYLVDLQNPNGKFGPQPRNPTNSAVALTRHIE